MRFISCDKKLAFVKNWLNIIDLIAILPYYLMLTASKAAIGNNSGIPDFTTPYRRWLEGMRMLEGIDTRTEMVMDVDQVGDLRGGNLN